MNMLIKLYHSKCCGIIKNKNKNSMSNLLFFQHNPFLARNSWLHLDCLPGSFLYRMTFDSAYSGINRIHQAFSSA